MAELLTEPENDATDYEKEFGPLPHEREYAKVRAAQTGVSPGLGSAEAEAANGSVLFGSHRPLLRSLKNLRSLVGLSFRL